jgi:hypothetical protein
MAHVEAVIGRTLPRGNGTMNASNHAKCGDYFDDALAQRVYRAYERDFDRFGYPASLPD